MKSAVLRKARESAGAIESFFEAEADRIVACATALAARLDENGRLFCLGNGGSACDAQHLALEFLHPVIEKRRAFPALTLADPATLSAISNDADFARVYSDQLRLHARPQDVVVALSTSGKSASVIRALQAARELGALTVALTGRDGGRLPDLADHCFVVPSFSIHRIQEVHAVLLHMLWDLCHLALGQDDVL